MPKHKPNQNQNNNKKLAWITEPALTTTCLLHVGMKKVPNMQNGDISFNQCLMHANGDVRGLQHSNTHRKEATTLSSVTQGRKANFNLISHSLGTLNNTAVVWFTTLS